MKVAKRKTGDLALMQYASSNGEAAIQLVSRNGEYIYKARIPGKVVGAWDNVEELLFYIDKSMDIPFSREFHEAAHKLKIDQQ